MLALKRMNVPILSRQHSTNLHLPSEVLDHVAGLLHESTCRQLDTLFAFSLVSHQFRKSALPLLFGIVSHVICDRHEHCERGQLRRLLESTDLLGYVHTLHVLRPLEKQEYEATDGKIATEGLIQEHTSADLHVVRTCLPFMQRLRRIRYEIYRAGNHRLLLRVAIRVVIQLCIRSQRLTDSQTRLFRCFSTPYSYHVARRSTVRSHSR